MKILLVQSWLGGDGPPVYPVGLACLAAALAPGHEVACCDPNVAPDPLGALAQKLREFAPDLVGVSLRNIDSTNTRVSTSYLPPFAQVLNTVRAGFAGPLVVGGSGFSMFAQALMARYPAIDYGVYLEGEGTFAALADALAGGGDVAAVPSVYRRENGRTVFSRPSAKSDFADLPAPDFTVLPLAPYTAVPWGIGVETKRGCAFSCLYCPYGFLNGRTYRRKAPERVAEELAGLKAQGLGRFTFLDSVFNAPADHAAAVMEAMVRRDLRLSWSAWFTERGLTREFLELARRAGCDTVIFSPDAYGDAALRALDKAVTRAEIDAAYALVRDMACFDVSYNFFKNPPGQTLRDALALLGFIVRARRQLGRRAHFELSSLRVEPHTALAARATAEGIVAPGADLLEPVRYTQGRTAYIEKFFDMLLKARGR
ncbi:B12-binding domain-containing radical SAM protein [Solidesulfovibrio sp.]|uniref:B12-binding domain-containing radical SAM protein n=1 Tax=Solidesulfovibrio sp. TaxID=2910990 RepID=UPI002B21D852|nr:cobalamin-dependent protein [Solidesulfovibrio sp.]MEA5088129.1 cobalamin-dependent protein [Solidesulfovibrio sp.]HML59654.1 cobalamin-dependent protein [Solidesulfovibrio sp.]